MSELRDKIEKLNIDENGLNLTVEPTDDEKKVSVFINDVHIEDGPYMHKVRNVAIYLSKVNRERKKNKVQGDKLPEEAFVWIVENAIDRLFPLTGEILGWEEGGTEATGELLNAWGELSQKKAEAEKQAASEK